jgi:hypothetical protein
VAGGAFGLDGSSDTHVVLAEANHDDRSDYEDDEPHAELLKRPDAEDGPEHDKSEAG